MGAPDDGPDARLQALWQKVEDFTARVDRRYPGDLKCAAGCSGCCDRRLTVTGVEAAAIRGWLEQLAPEQSAQLASRARASGPAGPCAALDAQGRCGIYPVRPLVCRSHGVPLRLRSSENPRALPVVTVCPLNFTGRALESVDADCVLDQTTLSTVLYAINAAADAPPAPQGSDRRDLAALLAGEVC